MAESIDAKYFNSLPGATASPGILRVNEAAPAPNWDKLSFIEKRLLMWQREAQQGKAR